MSRTSRRILLVCTKFGRGEADRYLTNELADSFVELGCAVCVVAIDWNASAGLVEHAYYVQSNGVQVVETQPFILDRLGKIGALCAKWGGSSWFAAQQAKRHFKNQDFDLLIAFSPVVVTAFVVLWGLRHFKCRSYAYVVDFFPFHHRCLGAIPGGAVFKIARWAETALLERFDVIGCMSNRGVAYLREHYGVAAHQKARVLRLWGPGEGPLKLDPAEVRAQYVIPVERSIAVFGGQITHGRGIEEILQAAALARDTRPDLIFLFVGGGRLEPLVREQIANGADNVMLLAGMGRDQYLTLASACDVGIVCTVPNVDVPTFPSKTIDYLRAGLPVVASVEATTDFGDFVREQGFGLATGSGHPEALLAAIETIVDDSKAAKLMRISGQRTLHEVFAVEAAARTILAQVDEA
jgi:glycosyltransferase involved in cell wall biosynthesis